VKPDAIIDVRFLTSAEGGRAGPLIRGEHRCIAVLDGANHDCLIYYKGQTLDLGQRYELPVRFLFPEDVAHKLAVGAAISLRELRTIAEGTIVSLERGT
jgi:hypothetical protein